MPAASLYIVCSAFLTGVAGVILVDLSTAHLVAFVFIGLLSTATLCKFSLKGSAILLAALVACVGGGVRATEATPSPTPLFDSKLNTQVILTGTIIKIPDERETTQRIVITVEHPAQNTQVAPEGLREQARVLVVAQRYPPLFVGDMVRIEGKLEKPKPFASDGGRLFAYDRFLEKDGVRFIIQRAAVERVGQSPNGYLYVVGMLASVRAAFMRALASALPEPESSLAAGIIVGGKQGLGEELITAFTNAGMLQLVVLSGYNIGIIADAIMRALAGFPKRISTIAAIASIVAFVVAAGAGASAVRAAIMGCIGIYAHATGKHYVACRILMVSLVLMTLWNPLPLVYDPGLQFSFLATLGLILGTPIVTQWFSWIRPQPLREVVASILAAQIGVLPMLLWQTGNLSFISVVANVLAVPLIPPAMAASALAALISWAEPFVLGLSTAIAMPAYALLRCIIALATTANAVPYAHTIIPAFSFYWVPLAYMLFAGLVWQNRSVLQAEVATTPLHRLNTAGY